MPFANELLWSAELRLVRNWRPRAISHLSPSLFQARQFTGFRGAVPACLSIREVTHAHPGTR